MWPGKNHMKIIAGMVKITFYRPFPLDYSVLMRIL